MFFNEENRHWHIGLLTIKYYCVFFCPKKETLRTALAMGADRAIHVEIDGKDYETLQPIHVSKILAKLAQNEKADVIIVGKQASIMYLSPLLKEKIRLRW